MNNTMVRLENGAAMKYRLKGEGEDSLLEYMRKRQKSISWLAREVGMSRVGVDDILRGKTRRSNTENLERIAKELGLRMDADEEGLYFEYSDDGEMTEKEGLVRELHDGLSRMVRMLSPEQKKLIEEVMDVVVTPDDRDILVLLIDVLKLRRKRKLM